MVIVLYKLEFDIIIRSKKGDIGNGMARGGQPFSLQEML